MQTGKTTNSPQLPRHVKGGEAGGTQSQTNQPLNAPLTMQ